MSNKEVNKKSQKEVQEEKIVTRYDRKMQRRQEEKAKEEKRRKLNLTIGVVVLAALVVFMASFPVRSYLATHQTYLTINGEKITKVEFDYNYNLAINNYTSQFGSYLSYFGLDLSQDLSTQMYTDTLSWKDFFEEMAVDNMKSVKGLKAEADAAGYEYDSAADVETFKNNIKEGAETAGVSTKRYVKQLYGAHATLNGIAGYVAETARTNAYYQMISEDMEATDEEIQAYYEEHASEYDSVDYYLAVFPAEIEAEEPTEEEIEAAMNDACDQADAAVDTLEEDGNLMTGEKEADMETILADWLFEEGREEGDTNVLADEDNNIYYAVQFAGRYLDEEPTADVRVIMTQETDGQTILDEWTAGAATEESFIELCDKYSADNGAITEGGLMEGVTEDGVSPELAEWIFADGRESGDTTAIVTEEGYTYVMYYVGQGDPEWKNSIASTLLNDARNEYMDALAESVVVEDPKGRLNYLKVQAEEDAEEESGEETDSEDVENAEDGESGADAEGSTESSAE